MVLVPLKFELKSEDAHLYLVEHDLIDARCEDVYGIEVQALISVDPYEGYCEIEEIERVVAWLPNGKEIELDGDDFDCYVEAEIERQSSTLYEDAQSGLADAAEARYEAMREDR